MLLIHGCKIIKYKRLNQVLLDVETGDYIVTDYYGRDSKNHKIFYIYKDKCKLVPDHNPPDNIKLLIDLYE